jgi:hypothetical protein
MKINNAWSYAVIGFLASGTIYREYKSVQCEFHIEPDRLVEKKQKLQQHAVNMSFSSGINETASDDGKMIHPAVPELTTTTTSSSLSEKVDDDKAAITTTTHPDWCPVAKCQNSEICQPCRRRFLIVIASGRSASTTLMWMLNSLPNVRLSGENQDLIKRMREMVDATRKYIKQAPPASSGDAAWYHNPLVTGSFACAVQPMMEVINPPNLTNNFNKSNEQNMILGFKTVRFHDRKSPWGNTVIPKEELPAHIEFIKEVFPCARIIVNLRSNTKDQASSGNKAFPGVRKNITQVAAGYEFQNEKLRYIAELFGEDQAVLLDSSVWTKNISVLNQAVAWLGFDKSCFFKQLLEFNTGKYGYGHGKQKLKKIDPKCRYVGGAKA